MQAKTQPWGAEHPGLLGLSDEQLGKVIPLQIHVDGAEMFKGSEHLIFSISSVFADSVDIMDVKFAVIKIPTVKLKNKATLQGVMERVAAYFSWNFQVLQEGVVPSEGFYGEDLLGTTTGPIMGGYTCAFAFFKCDTKARVEAHGFSNYWHGNAHVR